MRFIDLDSQYQQLKLKIHQRIQTVLEHGQYIMGPEVSELEKKLANYVGIRHCICVSSGTDALLLALMALNVGPGDEVITTPFSFIAIAEMVLLLGATPVFVDIDPKIYNLDPQLLEQVITPKTKVIAPVNIYGQCADYDAINLIAKQHGLQVIEDAGQSFGAMYKGKHACSLGDIGCTSFYPAKPLGCYGDGGACFTDNDALAHKLRSLRDHGQEGRYHHVRLGINGRFDTLQAAILLEKLTCFPEELKQRQTIAKMYNQCLRERVTTPYVHPHNFSTYAQYTIQVENRDAVRNMLIERDIPTAIHYPIAIHKQPIIEKLTAAKALPIAEEVAQQVISLPFHSYMTKDEVRMVADAVTQAVAYDLAA